MRFSLKTQILLVMALVYVISFAVLTAVHYHSMKQGIISNRTREARDIRSILMATRRIYQHQFIDSGLPLNDKTIGFLPAHALGRISGDFGNWSESGMSFNNVSDRPRNPSQVADALELEAMAYFRANPDQPERMVSFTSETGRSFFHFSAPIFVEKYCLKCHGDEAAAPAAIRKLYDTAFDYQVGDLRGVMSIKLPNDEFVATLWHDLLTMGLTYMLTLLASLTLVYLLLQRRVLNHLGKLVGASAKVGQGDFDIHLSTAGQGELDQAAKAFNAMAGALRQRETEQRLLREEAHRYLLQMESVFNNTTSIIYIKDPDGRYRYINRPFETLLNVSSAEIQGKRDHDLFPRATADALSANDLRVLEEGRTLELEEILQQEDGDHIYFSVKFPLKSTSGETYAVCGISTDITGRLGLECSLREQAALWGSLMASTSEGVLGMDRDGACTFCNPAALELLGYRDVSELLGKDLHSLIHARYADGSDYPLESCRMNMVIDTGVAVHVKDEVLWRADGRPIPVVYRASPIREAGEVSGVVITFEEISEWLKVQQVLRERLDELEQFNRLAVGRELKMMELKQEVNALLRAQGAVDKYKVET